MPETQKQGIYALGLDGLVYYVGQSTDIDKRYRQHCSGAQNRGNTKKNLWIQSLLETNQLPNLRILEITDVLDEREVYWIQYYRALGQAEMNMTDGGVSFEYAERTKQMNPWGKGWSPVRRRLNQIQDAIKTLRSVGMDDRAERLEEKLVKVNEAIQRVGLKQMNEILWSKYGQA